MELIQNRGYTEFGKKRGKISCLSQHMLRSSLLLGAPVV